jgi:beta-N-acetylhexosaminidase
MTDDMAMKAISGRFGLSDATVQAIAAGCDAVLMCAPQPESQMAALEALIYAVEQGRVPQKRVDDALARQRKVKQRFLASPRSRPASGSALRAMLGRDEHQAIAAEMARFA